MNQADDDPFFSGGDRTIIRPLPGGRLRDLQRQADPQPDFVEPAGSRVRLEHLSKLNPLDSAASPILALLPSLYNSPSHPSPERLRQRLTEELRHFEASASQAGIEREQIEKASYALCTTIDEAVFNTPWGRQCGWAEQSLLSTFHNEGRAASGFSRSCRKPGRTRPATSICWN
ncbi:MAG: type IVB secretion system protein IcmH/DotU [Thiolinea sp.]